MSFMIRLAAGLSLSMLAAGAGFAQSGGGYTAAQAERGARTVESTCSLCHGQDLTGGPGTPPLTGPEFQFGWKGKSAAELLDYVRKNMPPGGAGSLSDQQYADIVARILQVNGQPPGAGELTPDPVVAGAVKIGG